MVKNNKKVAVASNPLRRYNMEQPAQMARMATVLKSHIIDNGLFTDIKGNNYVNVEGWQFAGGLLGLVAIVRKVEDISDPAKAIIKYKAEVELVNMKDGKVVGYGFAICTNREAGKTNFDEYAVASMAQTRAVGKAYRLLIGWVMKLAGYEGTPAEEMQGEGKAGEGTGASKDFTELMKRVPRMKAPIKKDTLAKVKAGNWSMSDEERKELTTALTTI